MARPQLLTHLIRPDLEAHQRIGAEGVGDGNVGGVAAAGDQHPAAAGDVEAAAERDRQMGIVAADTGAIGEGVQAQAISAVGSQ